MRNQTVWQGLFALGISLLFIFTTGCQLPSEVADGAGGAPTSQPIAPIATPPPSATEPSAEPTNTPTTPPINEPTHQPTIPPTSTPTHQPTIPPTNTPTTQPTSTGPRFTQDTTFPTQNVQNLFADQQGEIWAITNRGVWQQVDGVWVQTQTGSTLLLGEDDSGRIWFWLNGDTLAQFSVENGWQRVGVGLGDFTYPEDAPRGVAVDPQGGIWVAHGRNGLHHFNPAAGSWTTYAATDLGYPPPPESADDFGEYDPALFFTSVAADPAGNIWTAACPHYTVTDGPPRDPLRPGDGARWFNGESWAGPADSAASCVRDLAVDDDGRVWLARQPEDVWSGPFEMLTYSIAAGWERIPLPDGGEIYPVEMRPIFAGAVERTADGTIWIFIERFGGASSPASGLYSWDAAAGRWQTLGHEIGGPNEVTFDLNGLNGEIWAFARLILVTPDDQGLSSGLYRWSAGVFEPILADLAPIDPESIVLSESGVWALGANGQSIWKFLD